MKKIFFAMALAFALTTGMAAVTVVAHTGRELRIAAPEAVEPNGRSP